MLADKLKWLVYVLILGSLSSGLLAGVSNLIPADGDEPGQELKLLILSALDIAYTTENIDQEFQENITLEEIEGLILYRSGDGSVAFEFSGKGHMGPISGLIALGPDLKTLRGLVITEQQETPGLGGRIGEAEFLDQFRGLSLDPELVIVSPGREASADNEVDGITGATMTSKALESTLNQSIQEIVELLEVN